MAEPDKRPVTMEELLVSSLAQTDALAKLLIEKGLITREEFMQKISVERATYQRHSIRRRNELSPQCLFGNSSNLISRLILAKKERIILRKIESVSGIAKEG